MSADIKNTDYVRGFREMAGNQFHLAGGKGSVLARLYQAGYPVPDGFVIFPVAFSLDELLPEAWEQIQLYWQRLRVVDSRTFFAVRSSSLGEDSLLVIVNK
jgi:rifampicin phosphotransferase